MINEALCLICSCSDARELPKCALHHGSLARSAEARVSSGMFAQTLRWINAHSIVYHVSHIRHDVSVVHPLVVFTVSPKEAIVGWAAVNAMLGTDWEILAMINNQAVPDPLRVRRRSTVRTPTITQAPQAPLLGPGQIAFAGSASAQKHDDSSIDVQVLCWPIVPTSWSSLTQMWERARAGRGEPTAALAAINSPTSWIRSYAPQLGAPFRDTQAEESSVAALLTRTPIEIAIAVVDPHAAQATKSNSERAQTHALSDCLSAYSQIVRVRRRGPCALLVSRSLGDEADQQFRNEFAHCQTRMPESGWLNEMQLRFWNLPIEPLPLELAQVVAAAVVRYQLDERGFNPIFEATLTKRVHNALPYKRTPSGKRR